MKANALDFELDRIYHLSSGPPFKYRLDRYSPEIIHVEMFSGEKVIHKQIAIGRGVNMTHHQVINALEAKLQLGQLDATGLLQIIPNP